MTEADFQQRIVAAATAAGWLVYHTHDSRRSEPGYPDLTLVHPARGAVLWAEVKAAGGVLRPEQVAWHEALADAGHTVRLWAPGGEAGIERCLGLPPGTLATAAVRPSEAPRGPDGGKGPQAGVAAQGGAESVVPSDREVWLRQRSRQLQAEGIGACAAERTAEREWREALEADAAAARRREQGHELG